MRLIDADKYPCQNCSVSYCHQNCDRFIEWFNNTVEAYAGGQVEEAMRQARAAIQENSELRTMCGFLKSCVNCKLRKECPRHCGKVVHDCDHWEYGDPMKDAADAVKGRWVSLGAYAGHKCGVCEDYYTDDARSLYFCPRCGTEMVEIELLDYRRNGLPIGAPWAMEVCKHGRRPKDEHESETE